MPRCVIASGKSAANRSGRAAWSTNTEQRFQIRMAGSTKRHVIDFDGPQLIRIPLSAS